MRIIVLAMSVFLASCATNTPSNFYPTQGEIFFVKNIVLNLEQKCQSHNMPDADELSNLFKSQIDHLLAEKKLLATENDKAIGLHVEIDYKREFVGETFGLCKSYGVSKFSYESYFMKGDDKVARYSQATLIPNHGTIGNFEVIAKQLSNTGGESLEKKNINIFSNSVVENISRYRTEK